MQAAINIIVAGSIIINKYGEGSGSLESVWSMSSTS
jgi:hypothetical protein